MAGARIILEPCLFRGLNQSGMRKPGLLGTSASWWPLQHGGFRESGSIWQFRAAKGHIEEAEEKEQESQDGALSLPQILVQKSCLTCPPPHRKGCPGSRAREIESIFWWKENVEHELAQWPFLENITGHILRLPKPETRVRVWQY
jgi:hypothetical protein